MVVQQDCQSGNRIVVQNDCQSGDQEVVCLWSEDRDGMNSNTGGVGEIPLGEGEVADLDDEVPVLRRLVTGVIGTETEVYRRLESTKAS